MKNKTLTNDHFENEVKRVETLNQFKKLLNRRIKINPNVYYDLTDLSLIEKTIKWIQENPQIFHSSYLYQNSLDNCKDLIRSGGQTIHISKVYGFELEFIDLIDRVDIRLSDLIGLDTKSLY